MNPSWFENRIRRGVERGFEFAFQRSFELGFQLGMEIERREIVREQLGDSFGPLPAHVLARLQQLSLEQLRSLSKLIRRATSLKELGLED